MTSFRSINYMGNTKDAAVFPVTVPIFARRNNILCGFLVAALLIVCYVIFKEFALSADFSAV